MGTTAICLVQSPWGRQSGAHMNPSLTLTFLRLGKIARPDACFYVVAQFIGAVIGITAAATLIGPALGSPEVNYVATTPGARGSGAAFAAELAISFVLMLTVLLASNTVRLARFTPLLVGALIATYITLEAPLSGMSMNPARTFGPPLGMLMAAELFVRARGTRSVLCAKLHHLNDRRCIFHCGYSMSVQTGRAE
jgi:aquaporin Z